MNTIKIGTENTAAVTVDSTNTAKTMGSGSLEVFATPAVAALIERAACELVQPMLDEGITTVGTLLSINHVSASPIGAEITAKAVLTAIDGRKFCFDVSAYDNAGLIAEGKHERFSVKADSFMRKAQAKLSEKN